MKQLFMKPDKNPWKTAKPVMLWARRWWAVIAGMCPKGTQHFKDSLFQKTKNKILCSKKMVILLELETAIKIYWILTSSVKVMSRNNLTTSIANIQQDPMTGKLARTRA